MKKNMGFYDRAIRLSIATTILTLYFTQSIIGTWNNLLLWVAILLVLTSVLGFCPFYMLFNIRTCKKEQANTD